MANKVRANERNSNERGAIAIFFAFFLIPLLFFLYVLSLDVVRFYESRERAQQLLDQAAIEAVAALPYQAQAIQRATAFLTDKLGALGAALTTSVSSDAISLSLERMSTFAFADFFGLPASLPFTVVSSARITPLDLVIAMDNSSYLAPVGGANGFDGGNPGLWPASVVFSYLTLPPDINGMESKLFLTQRCHNSAITPIKAATQQLYDFLGSVAINSVGLAFYPAELGAMTFPSRDVKPAGFDLAAHQGEARVDSFVDSSFGVVTSDANCGAMLDQDSNSAYQLPGLRANLSSPSSYPGSKLVNNISQLLGFAWDLNPAYSEYLSAREAIWSRGVRNQSANVSRVMSDLEGMVRGAMPVAARGGLVNSARKAIVLVAGDVPYEGGLRFPDPVVATAMQSALGAFDPDPALDEPNDIDLYYLILKSEANPASIDSDIAALQGVMAAYPRARLIAADNASTVASDLIGILTLAQRRAVLKG